MRSSLSGRRALVGALALAVSLAVTVAGGSGATATPAPPDVVKMSALGDSITRGTSSCSSFTNCLANSWATGTSTTVNSHYLRLRNAGASTLVASNNAVNGATSGSLPAQAQAAVSQSAQYVTIEIGANDACTSTVGAMTARATFRANIDAALATLAASPAAPEIFVASIPNLLRMYDLNKSSATARFTWSALRICQSLLANPSSTKPADVNRRAAVQARVTEYNQELAAACAAIANCRFDGLAIANLQFVKSDISTRDYFHPSVAGQQKFASVTWPQTQWVTP
jgi:lysophospholipase L1-like esterase